MATDDILPNDDLFAWQSEMLSKQLAGDEMVLFTCRSKKECIVATDRRLIWFTGGKWIKGSVHSVKYDAINSVGFTPALIGGVFGLSLNSGFLSSLGFTISLSHRERHKFEIVAAKLSELVASAKAN